MARVRPPNLALGLASFRDGVRVWIFTATLAAGAAVAWSFDVVHHRPAADATVPWFALAVVFYVAETWVVHLHFRKQAHTLSLPEIALVLGLVYVSPLGLLGAQLIGAGLAFSVHRRQRPIKLFFNLAQQALCTGVAFAIFVPLAGPGSTHLRLWGAALLAAGVSHASGIVLVSLVISVAERRWVAPQIAQIFGLTLIGALAAACVGLVGVELIGAYPLSLVLLLPPAAACGLAFRGFMEQREQREHVEFLYDSMRAAQGAPELGLAVGQLLVAGRRLLRAEYAEILLLPSAPGEGVLRSSSGPMGELLMHPEPMTPEIAAAFAQATGGEGGAVLLPRRRDPHPLDHFLASRGIADGVVGPLRGEERVFGVLVIGGRVSDVSTFEPTDLTLFETFTGHASILLENGRLEQTLAQLTELKEELKHQAYHDALTGLPNRVLFAETVDEALADQTHEHAVLFLDLDRFKMVNDSWGHAAGDELLQHVADRIRGTVRPTDVPARLGGDEFAVLLRDTDAHGAERAAERIIEAIEGTFILQGREANVSTSIGIALTGPESATTEELLRNADIAMYVAKTDEHRRHSLYAPELHARARNRHELAIELRRAIDRDELEVHYQPVLSLVDGRVRAFEALVRWQHPERGLLPPGEFLGIAEESGLMVELGSSVVEQALRAAREWDAAAPGSDIGLWVNLAPAEFGNERLVEDLALALTKARFDARRLTVEITESSVMRDEATALRAMHGLRELGVCLSIDDFGTGYSSLSRLAEFPIELLKIPRPFVERLAGNRADASFVEAILRLAVSLGLDVVAEGIERIEEAARLRELACPLGQGYLFSRPLERDAALRFLRSNLLGDALPLPAAAAQ